MYIYIYIYKFTQKVAFILLCTFIYTAIYIYSNPEEVLPS